jgi:hypothetical protein
MGRDSDEQVHIRLDLRQYRNPMLNESKPTMDIGAALSAAVESEIIWPSIADQIAAFLDGRTHGEGLLHALYDYVLDEPIPPRMRALLQEG